MVRVEPEVKNQAESVLSELGLPTSVAINAFYRQIIINNGLPFKLTKDKQPLFLEDLTQEDINAVLDRGINQMEQKNYITAEDAEQRLLERYQ